VRRNHALEHATIHVLVRRRRPHKRLMVAGRSTDRGFFVYGAVDTDELHMAVSEALARLRGGGLLRYRPLPRARPRLERRRLNRETGTLTAGARPLVQCALETTPRPVVHGPESRSTPPGVALGRTTRNTPRPSTRCHATPHATAPRHPRPTSPQGPPPVGPIWSAAQKGSILPILPVGDPNKQVV